MDSFTRFTAWLATAATLTVRAGASASQFDPQLDKLFADLRMAASGAEARRIEAEIWRLWLRPKDELATRFLRLGLTAMAGRRHDEALEAFDELVEIAPDFAEGWNKRATVHYLLGNLEDSVADIERTLGLEPRHFGALSGLGLISLSLGRLEDALTAFEAAVRIHPNLPGGKRRIRDLRAQIDGKGI